MFIHFKWLKSGIFSGFLLLGLLASGCYSDSPSDSRVDRELLPKEVDEASETETQEDETQEEQVQQAETSSGDESHATKPLNREKSDKTVSYSSPSASGGSSDPSSQKSSKESSADNGDDTGNNKETISPASPMIFDCQYMANVLRDMVRNHYSFGAGAYDPELFADHAILNLILALDRKKVYFSKLEVDRLLAKYDSSLHQQLMDRSSCQLIDELHADVRHIMRQGQEFLSHNIMTGEFLRRDEYHLPAIQNKQSTDWRIAYRMPFWQENFIASLVNAGDIFTQDKKTELSEKLAAALELKLVKENFYFAVAAAHGRSMDSYSKIMDFHETSRLVRGRRNFNNGIEIEESKDGHPVVVNIVEGSSADIDGRLQVGDQLYQVSQDDESWMDVSSLSVDELNQILEDPTGEFLNLSVLRQDHEGGGQEHMDIRLIRKRPFDQTQQRKLFPSAIYGESSGVRVGYLIIDSFFPATDGGDSSADLVASEVADLLASGADAFLVDLRNNVGGELQATLDMVNLFSKLPVTIYQRKLSYCPGKSAEYITEPQVSQKTYEGLEAALSIPLIFLVSHQTASSAEIMAGSLQAHGRALIIGSKHTFGKSTVQTFNPMVSPYVPYHEPDQPNRKLVGSMVITTSKYFLPDGRSVSGRTIHEGGLTSDIVLPSPLHQLSQQYRLAKLKQNPFHQEVSSHQDTFDNSNLPLLNLGFRDPSLVAHLKTVYSREWLRSRQFKALESQFYNSFNWPMVNGRFMAIDLMRFESVVAEMRMAFSMKENHHNQELAKRLLYYDRELGQAMIVTGLYHKYCRGISNAHELGEIYNAELGCMNSAAVLADLKLKHTSDNAGSRDDAADSSDSNDNSGVDTDVEDDVEDKDLIEVP